MGAEETRSIFSLFGDSPIFRILLINAGDRYLLVLTIHHVACDGISATLIMNELKSKYLEIKRRGYACTPGPTF